MNGILTEVLNKKFSSLVGHLRKTSPFVSPEIAEISQILKLSVHIQDALSPDFFESI